MNTIVKSSWNVTNETIRREYGFSDFNGRRVRHFNENCLGSLYITQRMRLSHFLKHSSQNVFCMNFKHDRNLICTSNCNREIYIHDWLKDRSINQFNIKHSGQIYDLKFLNIAGNGLDLISSCDGGQVRHTCIAPAGNFVSKRIFLNTRQPHRLITVPRSPLEFIAGSMNGGIFQIDLRSECWSPIPDAIVPNDETAHKLIADIAHHPLVPEVCVCTHDEFVRIFDKRNLKCAVKKYFPNISFINGDYRMKYAISCSYNYNGSEILAHYVNEGSFLFNNKCSKSGEFLQCFGRLNETLFSNEIQFFGPKSEFIICALNGNKIMFQDKMTAKMIGCNMEDLESDTSAYYTRKQLQVHPHLPVVASSTINQNVSIWAPNQLKLCSVDNPLLPNGF